MTAPRLTIGQLAEHVGVTPRAIRFYHAQGLLPEPSRDDSGYRRYDAKAVVDLIRIKTLADSGVPLRRIADLLDSSPQEFSDALATIDENLKEKIEALEEHRRRLSALTQGEHLFLPDEFVELLEELRAIGVSERVVAIERDGWILAVAIAPDAAREWLNQKRTALADPDFRDLYLECDEAFDWDPADPRLAELAAHMAEWSAANSDVSPAASHASSSADMSVFVELLTEDTEATSAAWKRLGRMARD